MNRSILRIAVLSLVSLFAVWAGATDPRTFASAEMLVGTWAADMSTFPEPDVSPEATLTIVFGADGTLVADLFLEGRHDRDLGTWRIESAAFDTLVLQTRREGSSSERPLTVRFTADGQRATINESGQEVVFNRVAEGAGPETATTPTTAPTGVELTESQLYGQWEGSLELPDAGVDAITRELRMLVELRPDGSAIVMAYQGDEVMDHDQGQWRLDHGAEGPALTMARSNGMETSTRISAADEGSFTITDSGYDLTLRRVDPPRALPPLGEEAPGLPAPQ